MRIDFLDHDPNLVVRHIPLYAIGITVPSPGRTEDQTWFDVVAKIAAESAISAATHIRTSEQYQTLAESLEWAGQVVLGEVSNTPPLHTPQRKFEAAYVALALSLASTVPPRLRLRHLRHRPNRVTRLIDICMAWQDLNDLRAGLDTMRRHNPSALSDLQVRAWTSGGRVLGIETEPIHNRLEPDNIDPSYYRSPDDQPHSFALPELSHLVPTIIEDLDTAFSTDQGVHPWVLYGLMSVEREVAKQVDGHNLNLFVRTEEQWLKSVEALSKEVTVISPSYGQLSRDERKMALRKLLDVLCANQAVVSRHMAKEAVEMRHYADPLWLPVGVRFGRDDEQRSIFLAYSTNRTLQTRFFSNNLTVPSGPGVGPQMKKLSKKWSDAWEQRAIQLQLSAAFGGTHAANVGTWVDDRFFVCGLLRSELFGLSLHRKRNPHPDDGEEVGDFDAIVIDTLLREVRVAEVKRHPNSNRLRDYGKALTRYWSYGRRKSAFKQLRRKLQWLSHYASRITLPKGLGTLEGWPIHGCILLPSLPKVLWLTNSHLNAVTELGSAAAARFLSGQTRTIGATAMDIQRQLDSHA